MKNERQEQGPPASAPVESKRDPGPEDVARRAHELYEARGREEGRDLDDWFQAEQELRARPPRQGEPPE